VLLICASEKLNLGNLDSLIILFITSRIPPILARINAIGSNFGLSYNSQIIPIVIEATKRINSN